MNQLFCCYYSFVNARIYVDFNDDGNNNNNHTNKCDALQMSVYILKYRYSLLFVLHSFVLRLLLLSFVLFADILFVLNVHFAFAFVCYVILFSWKINISNEPYLFVRSLMFCSALLFVSSPMHMICSSTTTAKKTSLNTSTIPRN